MAEVMALDDEWVVKLDRPEFRGVAVIEAELLTGLRDSGVPVPVVRDIVELDDRTGFEMERLHGPLLADVIEDRQAADDLAGRFVDLHLQINAATPVGLADLGQRLAREIRTSGLDLVVSGELARMAVELGSPTGLCHFDFHPHNIIVTTQGWRVIDWLGAAVGSTHADFARTLLLRADHAAPVTVAFMAEVRARGSAARSLEERDFASWYRVVAAARLAEGFVGPYATWLESIARTDSRT